MPRLVEKLDDWSAVRLGALGPVREDAAHLLQRKRAAFLLSTTERQGLLHAEVFALFVLHSAHDDEVDEVLRVQRNGLGAWPRWWTWRRVSALRTATDATKLTRLYREAERHRS